MIRKLIKRPLAVMLLVHLASALATAGLVVWAVLAHKADPNGSGWLIWLGGQLRSVETGTGGMTLMWVILIPLAAVMAASLALGLVYGRWGLPGHLQGRAVYFVPFAAATYFLLGALALAWADRGSFGEAFAAVTNLASGWAGLSLVLIYACLATSAVGLGWAMSLAVTRSMRRRGKWETIGYVEAKA